MIVPPLKFLAETVDATDASTRAPTTAERVEMRKFRDRLGLDA